MILKVVQKILIKTRNKVRRRLKFSNFFQNQRSDAASIISIKTLKRETAAKFLKAKYFFFRLVGND